MGLGLRGSTKAGQKIAANRVRGVGHRQNGANGHAGKKEHFRLHTYNGKRGGDANRPTREEELGYICIYRKASWERLCSVTLRAEISPTDHNGPLVCRPTSLHKIYNYFEALLNEFVLPEICYFLHYFTSCFHSSIEMQLKVNLKAHKVGV